jgi:hypothetical protein
MAEQAALSGAPLFRPFVFDWPTWEPGWSLNDQYLLGDRIAVAPVVDEAATGRSVMLPAGTWHTLLDALPVLSDGSTPIAVSATVTEIPAFVPDCGLLVTYPPTIDTVVAAADPIVDAAAIADDREVWVYPCSTAAGWMSVLTEPGGLGYARSSGTFSSSGATWNGQPLTFTQVGTWATANVVGSGRLLVGDTELLRVERGRNDRRLTLRIAVP